MKKILLLFLVLFIPFANAKHSYNEHYYQNIWCKEHNGITEYILADKTRVDCLTKDYAIEFDFAPKWAESVGQSLYYAKMTKKNPAIVLIMESDSDEKYYERAYTLAKIYNINLYKINAQNYRNNQIQNDIFKDLISYFKNWLKLFLIGIIDSL